MFANDEASAMAREGISSKNEDVETICLELNSTNGRSTLVVVIEHGKVQHRIRLFGPQYLC